MVHQGIFTATRYFHGIPNEIQILLVGTPGSRTLHGSAHAAVIAGTQIKDTTFVDALFLCTIFVLATLCSHGDGERQP